MLIKEKNTTRRNRRLYEEHLLNKWIAIRENQIKIIAEVCEMNTELLFGELKYIYSFEPIHFNFDNIEDEIENSRTEHIKNYFKNHPEELTTKHIEERLYEKEVKDYLIKAGINNIFGITHNITLLCEIRSRFSHSPYVTSRLSDLKFLYNDIVNDSMEVQLERSREGTPRFAGREFMMVLISVESDPKTNCISWDLDSAFYSVSHKELKILEEKHENIFSK